MSTYCASARSQHGLSLMVVMVLLLLSSLLALGAARLGWLNEALVGNLSDEQRAFLAAEELMRDAQRDIQTPDNRAIAPGRVYFPLDATDLTQLQQLLAAEPVPCRNGLCFPAALDTLNGTGNTNWWQQGAAATSRMRAAGVAFGGVSGAVTQTLLLNRNTASALNHYWIEVFPFTPSGDTLAGRTPPADRPFVYRVTVVVDGLKAGTRVVLQSIMSP